MPRVTHSRSPPAICQLPADSGPCRDGSYNRWYYDTAAGTCKLFRYGGCSGNMNKFKTFNVCTQFCAAVRRESSGVVAFGRVHRVSWSTRGAIIGLLSRRFVPPTCLMCELGTRRFSVNVPRMDVFRFLVRHPHVTCERFRVVLIYRRVCLV